MKTKMNLLASSAIIITVLGIPSTLWSTEREFSMETSAVRSLQQDGLESSAREFIEAFNLNNAQQKRRIIRNDNIDKITVNVEETSQYVKYSSSRFLSLQIPLSAKSAFEQYIYNNAENIDPYNDSRNIMNIAGKILKELLPTDIQNTLKLMGETGSPSIVHLKDLPIDSEIPLEGDILDRVHAKGKVSECLILGMANLMGCEARPNPKEQGGRIIHNVAPVKGFEMTPSSRGNNALYLHTEEAFEDCPPDFLMLYGLVSDPNSGTTYHSIEDIFASFPTHIIEWMKKPDFKIRSNAGALDTSTENIYSLITLEEQEQNRDKLRLRLYGKMENVTPLTKEAQAVIEYINQAFESIVPASISLNPGEAIIFNNGWGINKVSGVMHGRKGIVKNPSRWLQRAFLFRNNTK